jgi:ankyrin repeat protein
MIKTLSCISVSPLHVDCSQGKEESVSLLLKTGFTVNVVDEYNSTPLFWAIYKRHRSVADILLSIDDIDVNSYCK